ncbi:MAG: hypothetical protein QNJ88_08180 [Acidimicrobiia bacterium]|nr:hypothetical protein [Acidimicrobiia bacterium]
MRRRKRESESIRSALIAVVLAVVMAAPVPAAGTGVDHDAVVGETPLGTTPQFLNGEVLAGLQVGNRVIVGGTFTRVRDAALGVVEQRYLASYDLHTGRLDAGFTPTLDRAVNSLADGSDATVIAVGRFETVNGTPRGHVAKLRLTNGSLDERFVADANGNVLDVAVAGERVFFGGSFTTVNARSRRLLAAVNLTTGAVDNGFNLPITGGTGYDGAFSVRGIDVSPNGRTLASVHNDRFVDGLPRQGVALIDISGDVAEVLPWRTDIYDFDCQAWYPQYQRPLMRDVQFSPDGSYVVVASAIGNFAPGCDTVIRFPVDADGEVKPDWISRTFDTPEALAVSDKAVYVGGHMRWAMAPGTVWTDFPNGNTDVQPPGTVARDQIMALNPVDGTALPWDPGAGGLRGVLALRTTDRGLLAGSDGERFGGIPLERHAFFPLPRPTPPAGTRPTTTIVAPGDESTVGRVVPLRVVATDDHGVEDIEVTVTDAAGRFLHPDGVFRTAAVDLSPLVIGIGSTSAATHALLDLAPGAYTITATAVDGAGRRDRSPAVATVTASNGSALASPDGYIDRPSESETVGAVVRFSGIAWDDRGVDKVRLIVQNRDTKEYLQADGTFAATLHRRFVQLADQRRNPAIAWSWVGELPEGRYRVRLFVRDVDKRRDPTKHVVRFVVNGN